MLLLQNWVGEMQSEEALGPACEVRHGARQQRGGVGGEDCFGGRGLAQLCVDLALEVEPLGDGFDY